MGLANWRRNKDDGTPPPKAVLAAAVPLAGPAASAFAAMRAIGTEAWQKDAMYFYDVIGEVQSPINRIALALSKAEPYAAVVDPDTGEPAGRSEDSRAQAAARMVLGGAKRRGQLLQTYAILWQVVGDAYVIVQPDNNRDTAEGDRWHVLGPSRIVEKGGKWSFMDPLTLRNTELQRNRDLMLRVWSPHPDDQIKANSAMRAAIPICAEVEKASQAIAARLDSRLASNGVYWLPSEADFPQGDHPSVADAWSAYFTELMGRSLSNPGSAGAQVPIVGVLPAEFIEAIRHDDLGTQFDSALVELRQDALGRLAGVHDMPKPTAEGTEADMNHWSAWQVDETTYKVFLEPLLSRLGDPLTEFWYRPILIAMGMEEAEANRTILAWDTTGIVARPDQTEDLKWAWDQRLISDEVMRNGLGLTEEDAPEEDELRRRALYDLVAVAPTLLADPSVAEALGLGIEIAPEAAGVAAGSVPGTPELESGEGTSGGAEQRTVPETEDDVPEGLTAAAEVIVLQSLARAGSRLLTRENRGQFASVPKEELYQHIRPSDPTALIDVRYCEVARVFGVWPDRLRIALEGYVSGLLVTGQPYSRDGITAWLREGLR